MSTPHPQKPRRRPTPTHPQPRIAARPRLIRTAVAPDPAAYRWLLSSLFGGYRGPPPDVPTPSPSRAPRRSPQQEAA
jgi:hypothetical protein